MRNIVITFGIICLCSLVLFQMAKVAIIKDTLPVEVLVGVFSLLFLVIGILYSRRQHIIVQHVPSDHENTTLLAPPSVVIETKPADKTLIEQMGISKREHDVLCEAALGLSNAEIAQKLFISESTVKTHISNLLVKLNARRRTEAVKIAKELNII